MEKKIKDGKPKNWLFVWSGITSTAEYPNFHPREDQV
jgi:hypothetical protein